MTAISSINNYTNINYNPNFKSYRHTITNNTGLVINRGDTCLFRYDLEFEKLINFLADKYQKTSKVNVIAHACSDGEEAVSFVTKLFDMLGKQNSKKFLPIFARDISEEHLECARAGNFYIEDYEHENLFKNLGNRYKNYFEEVSNELFRKRITVKDDVKKHIIYGKSNILDDVKHLNLKNTVLFARNFWPYLSTEDAENLAKLLSKKMDKSSTLIIGDFDKTYNIDLLLASYGFKESWTVNNVFEKVEDINKEPKLIKQLKKLLKKNGW